MTIYNQKERIKTMRNLNDYDVIFCDIDDTLIYGFWTRLMAITWKLFECNTLSNILMDLQYIYKIYKVNQKLRHMLVNSNTDVYFITARKFRPATEKMVNSILQNRKNVMFCHLATSNPDVDKFNKITFLMSQVPYTKGCFFDDNKKVRELVSKLDEIDVFDPTVLFENKIG